MKITVSLRRSWCFGRRGARVNRWLCEWWVTSLLPQLHGGLLGKIFTCDCLQVCIWHGDFTRWHPKWRLRGQPCLGRRSWRTGCCPLALISILSTSCTSFPKVVRLVDPMSYKCGEKMCQFVLFQWIHPNPQKSFCHFRTWREIAEGISTGKGSSCRL